MFKKILEALGFRLYCVTFTLLDRFGNYAGMFTVICYAESKGRATRVARKRLNRINIMFVGSWEISVEEI